MGGSGYLYLHYWSPVAWKPAIDIDMVNKYICIFMFNVQNEIASVRDHVFSYQCTRSYVSLLVHVIKIIMGLFYPK